MRATTTRMWAIATAIGQGPGQRLAVEAVAVEDTATIEEANWWGQFGGANLEVAVWCD